MKITVSSSSNDLINESYKNSAKEVLNYLVSLPDSELCWGSGNSSIMGLCYQVFANHNKKIYGYTTPKYVYQLKDLPKATHQVYSSTFQLKEHIFEDADIIICLYGGTGTISEFFAYLEEIRSNDINKLLIVYDNLHHFDKTLTLIDDLITKNFNDSSIYDYFKVVHNIDELDSIIKENNIRKK